MRRSARLLLVALLLSLDVAQAEEKVLRLYSWADYFTPDTLITFTRETGIRVVYNVMDSSETLETRLTPGSGGYDLIFLGSTVAEQLMHADALQKPDPRRLGHFGEIEPGLRELQARYARSRDAAVSYTWGTIGLIFNRKQIERRLTNAPPDSPDLLFKPELTVRFVDCGISLIDSLDGVPVLTLRHLGCDPRSGKPQSLAVVLALLQRIKSYIRKFQSQPVAQLVDEEVCLSLGYSDGVVQAQRAAGEAGKALRFVHWVPCEGTSLRMGSMAIPTDAQHPEYAYALISFIMHLQSMATISGATGYPTSSAGARALVSVDMCNSPDIYPDAATYARPFSGQDTPQRDMRARMRAWTTFKTTRLDSVPRDPK